MITLKVYTNQQMEAWQNRTIDDLNFWQDQVEMDLFDVEIDPFSYKELLQTLEKSEGYAIYLPGNQKVYWFGTDENDEPIVLVAEIVTVDNTFLRVTDLPEMARNLLTATQVYLERGADELKNFLKKFNREFKIGYLDEVDGLCRNLKPWDGQGNRLQLKLPPYEDVLMESLNIWTTEEDLLPEIAILKTPHRCCLIAPTNLDYHFLYNVGSPEEIYRQLSSWQESA